MAGHKDNDSRQQKTAKATRAKEYSKSLFLPYTVSRLPFRVGLALTSSASPLWPLLQHLVIISKLLRLTQGTDHHNILKLKLPLKGKFTIRQEAETSQTDSVSTIILPDA